MAYHIGKKYAKLADIGACQYDLGGSEPKECQSETLCFVIDVAKFTTLLKPDFSRIFIR